MAVKSEDDERFDRLGAQISGNPLIVPRVSKITACAPSTESLTIAAQRVRDCTLTAQRSLNGWKTAEIARLQAHLDFFYLVGVKDPESAGRYLEDFLKSE